VGLNPLSTQPDRAIVDVLADAGAKVSYEGDRLTVFPGVLHPFSFDATDCPDLFPPLVSLAAAIEGESHIKGVHRLASKESDRATVLRTTFQKLGVAIAIKDDTMSINGGTIHEGTIDSYGDHRIAMAAAIAALASDGAVRIERATCVEKSWPDFFEVLESLRVR